MALSMRREGTLAQVIVDSAFPDNIDINETTEINVLFEESPEIIMTPQSHAANNILFATTAVWNSQPTLIAKSNTLYVYTDYRTTQDGYNIPGFKIGDGTTYLIDLPFSDVSYVTEEYVKFASEAEWNAQSTLISQAGIMYVYTDHGTTLSGEAVPAYKVGDGRTLLIDLPFSDALLAEHIGNSTIHVTSAERALWNSKLNINDEQEVVENVLVFNRD